MTRFVLPNLGYSVLESRNGEEAIRICETPESLVDLVITGVVMPGMSGRQLAEAAVRLWPSIKVLYVSGYTDDAVCVTAFCRPNGPSSRSPSPRWRWPRKCVKYWKRIRAFLC